MSEYVFCDKDGNEIARLNKGRGRPRKDAVQSDENSAEWIVIVESPEDIPEKASRADGGEDTITPAQLPETSQDAPESKKIKVEVREAPEPVEQRRRRSRKAGIRYSVNHLFSVLNPIRTKRVDDQIILEGTYACEDLAGLDIDAHSVFDQVIIDESQGTVEIVDLKGHEPFLYIEAIKE